MTSPATMRLVGLLVIVGVVAGCGAAGPEAAGTKSAHEQVESDLVAIQAECDAICNEAQGQRYATVLLVSGEVSAYEPSCECYRRAYALAHGASYLITLAEMGGDHELRHRVLEPVRRALADAEEALDNARKAWAKE